MTAATDRPDQPLATVPAWVFRLDVEPPARHEGWRRAIRILHIRRPAQGARRRVG